MENQIKKTITSPDSAVLYDIKQKTGWTLERFASELGIPCARMSSYLYGKTKFVPANIMELARSLQLQERKDINIIDKLSKESMSDILSRWAEICGKSRFQESELSLICRVSVATVSRWFNGKAKPSPIMLIYYERLINEHMKLEREKTKSSRNKS